MSRTMTQFLISMFWFQLQHYASLGKKKKKNSHETFAIDNHSNGMEVADNFIASFRRHFHIGKIIIG